MNEAFVMIRPGLDTNRKLFDPAIGPRRDGAARLSLFIDIPISGSELAWRVRKMRCDRGMTQPILADLCDVSTQTISAIERNQQGHADTASFVTIFRIAEACGVEMAKVLDPAPFTLRREEVRR